MKSILREVVRAGMVVWIVFILGCNTMAGVGRDITDAADSTKVALRDYASK